MSQTQSDSWERHAREAREREQAQNAVAWQAVTLERRPGTHSYVPTESPQSRQWKRALRREVLGAVRDLVLVPLARLLWWCSLCGAIRDLASLSEDMRQVCKGE